MPFCEPLAHDCLLCKNFFSPFPVFTRTSFMRTCFCKFFYNPLHPPFLRGIWLRLRRARNWYFCNSSAPPDLHHRGGGNVFPPPLVGGVRGGGGTDTYFLSVESVVSVVIFKNSTDFL